VRDRDNPAKVEPPRTGYGAHRVVIPVHIPSGDGYHEQTQEILALCLDSLAATTGAGIAVTLVADGCCDEVAADLLAREGKDGVDQVLVLLPRRGKLDAVLPVVRTAFEPLVTVADADVLFRPGWLAAVEGLLEAFPECGLVALSPNPNQVWYHTSATVLGGMLRREVAVAGVVPATDLDRFAHSIGWAGYFGRNRRTRQLVVRRRGATALVGAGHFAYTVRTEIARRFTADPVLVLLGGEADAVDETIDRRGWWRLSTPSAFADHMGNRVEPWMHEAVAAAQRGPRPGPAVALAAGHRPGVARIPYRIRRALAARVLAPWLERRLGGAQRETGIVEPSW
jgi:hypothetical protein